jgi:hypothetical protein
LFFFNSFKQFISQLIIHELPITIYGIPVFVGQGVYVGAMGEGG